MREIYKCVESFFDAGEECFSEIFKVFLAYFLFDIASNEKLSVEFDEVVSFSKLISNEI